MIMQLAWVAAGGALGACSRYWLSAWIYQRTQSDFPWGTLIVNVAGSFLFGILFVVIFSLSTLKEPMRLLVLVGFLGAFTTFSTFSFETVRLLEQGQLLLAVANLLASGFCCVLGLWLGMGITRLLM